ncbi:hypothetical protein MNBD_GAMMA04-169 [hydrothermal vent metagenome]|uniref:Uncharacterized protein n=1 Tax=hydrothermal vent metagenome TaxID=652676 RepID=A0A3B0WF58_9ZZZZ
MIALIFYIGRTRIKKIDKVVYGCEFPNDNIVAVAIRTVNYGMPFLWKWHAKRSGLDGKIDGFDSHFRWPFVTALLMIPTMFIFMTLTMLFDKYVGIT